jgi:signal transduction histidine kinase
VAGKMADVRHLVSAPEDGRGRLIAIFVGAVLLPSAALSYVAFDWVHKLAKGREANEIKRAERQLFYIEKDLAQSARARALEAARAVGTERLLDGRQDVIRQALREAGLDAQTFEYLHLEASSPYAVPSARRGLTEDMKTALGGGGEGDSVEWPGEKGRGHGVLRFKFSCRYAHRTLPREYFEKEFSGPSLVVRVSEPDGELLYETASTPDGRFEVSRHMESPSLRRLKLELRYKDGSIENDVRHWKTWTLALIGLLDLTLGAGLYLVFSNVGREMRLAQLKSDFVANVSHELKTPLALIRLFAETLEMGRVQGTEKAAQYHRVINKETQRLTQLINNILDFSRIEAGKRDYRLAPVDVGRLVAEVVESYRFSIEQQGFHLDLRVAGDLPDVEADREALSQAVLNLLNNAVKFSREHKAVHVEVRSGGDKVLVSVADRGIGIAKGEQRKIFDKFYRAEDSLVHETKGSGLGLSLVRHIVEAHRGRVEVESAPGRGSTFTLTLPVRAAAPVPLAQEQHA